MGDLLPNYMCLLCGVESQCWENTDMYISLIVVHYACDCSCTLLNRHGKYIHLDCNSI